MPDQAYSPRNTIIAFIIVVIAIIGGAALLLTTRPKPVQITINPPIPTATPEPTATPKPLVIYVTGAVAEPESMVTLAAGSRVEDAIEAAGGMTDNADRERVNLAGILRDGDQIHVPEMGIVEAPLPTPSGGDVVHINSATLDELTTLPGIGPSIAQRILDYREANGPYANLDALDAVSGVGPSMLEKIADKVVFD